MKKVWVYAILVAILGYLVIHTYNSESAFRTLSLLNRLQPHSTLETLDENSLKTDNKQNTKKSKSDGGEDIPFTLIVED